MTEDYKKYLQSDQWKERRKGTLIRAFNRCEGCNINGQLDIHHLTYARIFNEPLSDLMALCQKCHDHIELLVAQDQIPRTDEPTALRKFTIFALKQLASTKKTDANEAVRESVRNDPEVIKRFGMNRKKFKRLMSQRYKNCGHQRARLMSTAMAAFDRNKRS